MEVCYFFPVPKFPGAQDVKNFRPIALLGIVSKICEKHVKNLLDTHITPRLSDAQYGFRKGRSTSDWAGSFNHLLSANLDRFKKVAGVFFDLRAAFDPAWPLLSLLQESYGVPDLLLK